MVVFSPSSDFWIIVASRDHVRQGVDGGFCQANHGKRAPLRKMKKGDWVVFYSPKERYREEEKCRRFTAIGTISDDLIYQVKMTDDFKPFRRKVDFVPCVEAPVEPLIPILSFISKKKSWGYVFRLGFLQVPRDDFEEIAASMISTARRKVG